VCAIQRAYPVYCLRSTVYCLMKAAVLHQAGAPLVIEDVPVPQCGPAEILIKVKACGVCHTDLHLASGEWRFHKLPLILGHEAAGVVERIGTEVANFKVGDRAGIPWIYSTCGECEYCTSDREPLCPQIRVTGFMVDGGYAEYVAAPASHAVSLPDGLNYVDAAPVFCAGLTPYRALKISGARVGDTVAIWGVGGLGHYAVQIARAMGAHVVAVDVAPSKLDLARQLGADVTVDASREDAAKAIRALGAAHVVINLTPTPAAIAQGAEAVRRGGTLVLVGLPPGSFTLPILQTVAKGIRILTSAVGTRQDLREVLALAAAGTIKTVAQTCRLEEINWALEQVREGHVTGRLVVEFT
jgi:alcohol dehydrogenase, propanol-preferring